MEQFDEFQLSQQTLDMLEEREIPEEWLRRTVLGPELVSLEEDGNVHYARRITEFGDRWLRVVVNQNAKPYRVVTLFFDRRLRRRMDEAEDR